MRFNLLVALTCVAAAASAMPVHQNQDMMKRGAGVDVLEREPQLEGESWKRAEERQLKGTPWKERQLKGSPWKERQLKGSPWKE